MVVVGIVLGLSASACWALANVAIQRAGRAVGARRALLWAQLTSGAAAAAVAAATEHPAAAIDARVGAWIAIAGVAALVGYLCLFYAFEHGRLTIAVPIMSSWAVVSAALSLALFHERLTPGQLAGGACVIAGAVVVARNAARDTAPAARGAPRWLFASLGAAAGFGVLIPSMRRLTPACGSLGVVAVVYAADIVLALPLAAAARADLSPPRGRAWWPVLAAGAFETAGSACITNGARHAPVAIVSPLASLATAFTVVFAWAALGERPPRGVLVGVALVSAGVVALAL